MNYEQLAYPLMSANGPCGDDLVFSTEFDEIREARRFDDPTLSQGEWITDIKEADWDKVIRLCEEILEKKSKDLRVIGWLTEARCKRDGLRGLADGYSLLGQLCDNFWNDIHPLAEDNDIEQRVGALDWLANQTGRLIRETPLTQSPKGVFSSIDLASSRTTAKQMERNSGSIDEIAHTSAITPDIFDAALKDTPAQFFANGVQNAIDLNNAIQSLQATLDAKMGEYSPAFGQAFEALEDVRLFLQRHASTPSKKSATESHGVIASSDSNLGQTDGADEGGNGPIRNREQAIRQLHEIGAFFRRTEPHSPVAYLAEKAAKWGTMPLHEWLRTVLKEDGALLRVEELLGVDATKNGEAS